MPGKIMDSFGSVGAHDLKKERVQGAEPGLSRANSRDSGLGASQPNGTSQNGVSTVQPNGISSDGPHHRNGTSSREDVMMSDGDEAPHLDQRWRTSGAFPSLGTIMERQAQHCYQNLSRCLSAMSELQVEPQHANGILPHAVQDTSKASQQKKRLLMNFAKEQREFFTKSLVLVDWCRNSDDIYKLKDVNEWQKNQAGAREAAAMAFLRIQGNMAPAKMPNPNIKGAMDLLSTSKASWIPDLGYLPPQRLPAKQLLETLRNMNVILATRLLLHQEIPQHMHDYSIRDGRVTFSVKDEFAVDLSVADEDPTSTFYFIDIRLLYRPSSSALDSRFRAQAEWRINQLLATKGLRGAYDFLHNFVLTHKINILRSQAAEMIRGKWFDCIRAEMQRRTLIVQYWVETPGKKSWLEFGIASPKASSSVLSESSSHISVRWFRQGVLVSGQAFDFDWKTLSLEQCVQSVIQIHSAWILDNLQLGIDEIITALPNPLCESNTIATDTSNTVLSLGVRSSKVPMTVQIEPVTGQLVISPPSRATREAEQRLHNDVTADRVKWITALICAAAQERAHKAAQLLGWAPATGLSRQENLYTFLGGKARFSIFAPSPAWGRQWALAVTFALSGEKWLVLRLEEKFDPNGELVGRTIASSRPVSLGDSLAGSSSLSAASLVVLEKTAVAELAFADLSSQLRDLRVPHRIKRLALQGDSARSSSSSPSSPASLVGMMIAFSYLMGHSARKKWKPWADEVVRLTHHGLVGEAVNTGSGVGSVRHDLRLTLEPGKLQHLQEHLVSCADHDLAMNSTGGLALQLVTPFGQSFALEIQTRLHSLERLNRYIAIAKHRRFECTHASLSRFSFVYNKNPRLSAEISFGETSAFPLGLRLEPRGYNPHQRLRVTLERGLNSASEKGFSTLLHVLTMSLPLLQALERAEAFVPTSSTFTVHSRSPGWFVVKYRSPLPVLTLQIRLRTKKLATCVRAIWLVQPSRLNMPSAQPASGTAKSEAEANPTPAVPEELSKALNELWRESNEHWTGMETALMANALGVAMVVDRVDELIRKYPSGPFLPPSIGMVKSKNDATVASGNSAANSNSSALPPRVTGAGGDGNLKTEGKKSGPAPSQAQAQPPKGNSAPKSQNATASQQQHQQYQQQQQQQRLQQQSKASGGSMPIKAEQDVIMLDD